jgi:hypothetical protein
MTMVVELYDALCKAGVDTILARAAAEAVFGPEDRAMLATKADVTELRAATKADIAGLRAEFTELRAEFTGLRTEFTGLRKEFTELRYATRTDAAELKADLTRWNAGLLVAMTAIFAGIVKLL